MLFVVTISIYKSYIAIIRKYSPSTWTKKKIGKIKEIKKNILE
jgi:hypothetical protein